MSPAPTRTPRPSKSHRRAVAAAAAGYFAEQITPVEVRTKKGTVVVTVDEHVRPGVTGDDLAKLRPASIWPGSREPGSPVARCTLVIRHQEGGYCGREALGVLPEQQMT